jgi:hypothetical protein
MDFPGFVLPHSQTHRDLSSYNLSNPAAGSNVPQLLDMIGRSFLCSKLGNLHIQWFSIIFRISNRCFRNTAFMGKPMYHSCFVLC